MDLLAQERHCWPELLLTILTAPSSECRDQSLCRSLLEKVSIPSVYERHHYFNDTFIFGIIFTECIASFSLSNEWR